MNLRRTHTGAYQACRLAKVYQSRRLEATAAMTPTEGGASAPTRGGRRCGSENMLCRKSMRCSSASRGALSSCRLKQSTARAAAVVAVGLFFVQLHCSGGASASSLAPHLANAAPLITPSTADSSRSAEFVGWRGRRRPGATESRTLLAGTVGLVADSAGKCDAGREADSGEWRKCCVWNQQQQLLVERVGVSYMLGVSGSAEESRVVFVLGSALSVWEPHAAGRRLLRSAAVCST